MSREHPEDFSPEFFQALETATEKGRYHIPCPIYRAKSLRVSFYHFRRALRAAEHPLAEDAYRLKFQVDGLGLTIRKRQLELNSYTS